jgi:hypothetical protein
MFLEIAEGNPCLDQGGSKEFNQRACLQNGVTRQSVDRTQRVVQ